MVTHTQTHIQILGAAELLEQRDAHAEGRGFSASDIAKLRQQIQAEEAGQAKNQVPACHFSPQECLFGRVVFFVCLALDWKGVRQSGIDTQVHARACMSILLGDTQVANLCREPVMNPRVAARRSSGRT
jgi:hypothetical protein